MQSGFWLGLGVLLIFDAGCRKKTHGLEGDADGKVIVAKIVLRPVNKAGIELKNRSAVDFYNSQRSVLEGDEVRAIALEKASAAAGSPAMKISVQVAHVNETEAFNIIAHCESVDYAKAFVQAMIEAYILKVQGVLQEPDEKETPAGNSAERSAAEIKLKDAEKALNFFKLEHDAMQASKETEVTRKRLRSLSAAESFYVSELDLMARSSLDVDVSRRKYPPSPPTDMPEEFVRVLALQLTPNEQAYLNAMTKADTAAIAATKQQAQKDHDRRIESLQHQLDAVKELIRDAQKKLSEMDGQTTEAKKLEAALNQSRAAYDHIRKAETQAETDALVKSNGPQVVVVIIQKPELVNVAP